MSRTRTTRATGADATGARQRPPLAPADATVRVPDGHDVAVARALLLVHRLDPERHACAGCGAACPCPPAQDAAEVIVAAGAWDTVAFTGPLDSAGPGRDRTSMLTRLAARLTGRTRAGGPR